MPLILPASVKVAFVIVPFDIVIVLSVYADDVIVFSTIIF